MPQMAAAHAVLAPTLFVWAFPSLGQDWEPPVMAAIAAVLAFVGTMLGLRMGVDGIRRMS